VGFADPGSFGNRLHGQVAHRLFLKQGIDRIHDDRHAHYLWVIFGFQLIAGVLLLVNRYVPLAVAVLGPMIVNILTFHVLMTPSGLPSALFVAVLRTVIFVDARPAFTALFQPRLQARA
jgi:putative oxidoreductase